MLVREVAVVAATRSGTFLNVVTEAHSDRCLEFRFTKKAVWWNTARTAKAGPVAYRASIPIDAGSAPVAITADTRERYPYRFAEFSAVVTRCALAVDDYAVELGAGGGQAVVERKDHADFVHSLLDNGLNFRMAALATLTRAALVIESRYQSMLREPRVNGGYLPTIVAALSVRFPNVQIVFADSRAGAEEWTYRWLSAAQAELSPPTPTPPHQA